MVLVEEIYIMVCTSPPFAYFHLFHRVNPNGLPLDLSRYISRSLNTPTPTEERKKYNFSKYAKQFSTLT